MLLEIQQGSKSYGGELVFSQLDFFIKEQEKLALVGRNGAGKTTLLKIITGAEQLDQGHLIKPKNIEIGYLAQQQNIQVDATVQQYLQTAFKELLIIQNKLKDLEQKLSQEHQAADLQEYAKLQTLFQQGDGYNIDYKLANIFTRFGFTESDLSRALATFSGGQKTKIAFVHLLLKEPDILLLDEPTNHLDLPTIQWLEEYLRKYPKALIIVSHDRYFIDHICNVTYELELGQGWRYGGNYSFFQASKKLRLEQEKKAYKNQQEEIARLQALIEKFRYKKNKAAFAQSKISYLDKMEKIELSKTDQKTFKADFVNSVKGGKTVCVLENYTIGYQQALATVNLSITSGQRLGVIGPNGCGKSTLLKSLANRIPSLSGAKYLGHQISIGYFDQELALIDNDNDVITELWANYPQMTKTEIRTMLGRFLFGQDEVFKSVKVLSGGEKVRLAFAKLMLRQDNFLVLDEPTNHLDILSREALEEALLKYQGTLLFVSHDRYFIDKLADSLLVYENANFVYYPLTYQEYLAKDRQKEVRDDTPTVKEEKPQPSINPEKQLKRLEKEITKAEEKLATLQEALYQEEYYSDFIKASELQEEIDAASDKLQSLLEQWEQLQ